MKKILTILFVLCCLVSEAQMKGTDTLRFMDRGNQWVVTNPYIAAYGNMRHARIGIVPSHYTTATLPAAPAQGAFFYNTDSVNKLALWTGSTYVYLGTATSTGVGITELNGLTAATQAFAINTSGTDFAINSTTATHTFSLPDASATARGVVTTGTQTIGGTKTFTGTITVGSTSNGVINIANSSASTRGSIDLTSNNPRLNSATGTWVFAQSGNTVGLYNGTGFFFGGGTTPSGFVVGILAGTTTNAPMRIGSGPLTTTPVTGNFEFLTDQPYWTITTGTARKPFALWDATPTSGRVAFTTTNGRLLDDADLVWDNSNKRLGISAATPDRKLEIIDVANPQLRLTATDASSYVDLQGTSNTLFVIPAGTNGFYTKTGTTSMYGGVLTRVWNESDAVASSGTSETDLYSITTPANLITTDGQSLRFEVEGLLTGTDGGTKTIKAYWAGTEVFSGTTTNGANTPYRIVIKLTRTSSSNAKVFAIVLVNGMALGNLGNPEITNVTTTFSGTNIIKITGTSTDADDGVNVELGELWWLPQTLPGT